MSNWTIEKARAARPLEIARLGDCDEIETARGGRMCGCIYRAAIVRIEDSHYIREAQRIEVQHQHLDCGGHGRFGGSYE